LIVLVFVLAGCSEETAAPVAYKSKKSSAVKPPPAKKVAPPVVKEEEVKEKPAEFTYVIKGRRDPFVPLTQIRRPIEKSVEPATPLERYDLPQFKLIGVIVGKGDPKAMVVAPDGKSYLLSKGLKIGKNNGVILDINGESIVVEEKYYDFSGNVIENIQEIAVPKR
jgi:type IV pilus assembly protein PilP